MKSPQQIANNACPFIVLTKDDEKAKRLRLLTNEGLSASKAADLLYSYELALPEKFLRFDKRELCVALITENKPAEDLIIADIANQTMQEAKARGLLSH